MSERGLRIHEFDLHSQGPWQTFVNRHPEATLFHDLAWKRAVERAFGHRSRYLIATRNARVVGILPLFEIKSVLAGRLLVSVPYATYGGMLTDGPESAAALFNKAKGIAARIGARSIEFRSIKAAVRTLDSVNTHATFRKMLPRRAADVPGALPRKARAAARRAGQRHRLRVEFNTACLPTVWQLYARSMRRLGSVNYPYQFFEELVSALGGRSVVQLVFSGDRPVAGLLTFLYRDAVLPYFAGLDERAGIYGLNNYLYAESMRWGVEHGYRVYDFGRTRLDNTGSYNFKRSCGFEAQVLEFQTYVMPGRAAPDLAPSSPRWAAARRVWRSLPLPITRPVGGWLAKSIPG
ncbi:MAG: FemAB family XrtA/PEP-CTERM system-associated protein [Planctomycetota bacterium]